MRSDALTGAPADAPAAPASAVPPPGRLVLRVARHLAAHLRDRKFWVIQAMVIGATGAHYAIELMGDTDPAGPLHAIALTALIVPLVYAALNFGFEGAVLTSFWAGALALPALVLWHEQHAHWVIEIAHLGIILPVGVIVAWRVDRETTQRRRAEQTSAGLALLNEVAEILSAGIELDEQLPRVVRRLVSGIPLQAATLTLEPEAAGTQGAVFFAEGELDAAPAARLRDADRQVAGARRDFTVALAGKSGTLGSVSAVARDGELLDREQQNVLAAAAHAIQVSVENAMLRRQRQESLQLYARQVTDAHEDERLRLARELHDDTAQELVNLVRRLERLEENAAPAQLSPLADAADLGRHILQGVRRYSHNLRPPVLDDLGVRAAIEVVVEDASAHLPGGARLTVTGTPRRLSGPQELAIFRIAQEAMRNVEKHASASAAEVRLAFAPAGVTLTVTDDGRGFRVPSDLGLLAREGHFGLVGMHERAQLSGGRLEVRSSERGTTIRVEVREDGPRSA